jgi:sulfide:quinone oxidoreductase
MAKVVVLGAGISGHTAIAYLRRQLGREHELVMVSPNSYYHWIPSNIWVGVGRMKADQVRFKLAPLYKKWGVDYKQAKVVDFYPEGQGDIEKGFVTVEYVAGNKKGTTECVDYDFLINATGPKLNFEATEGLTPGEHTVSVCSYTHATEAWEKLQVCLDKMENGEKQTFLIGTGHAMSTCQGAAFEYILNVDFEIKRRGLEHMAEVIWISNEYELGDFGMGGAFIKKGGYITSTKVFTESYFKERHIDWIKRAAVSKVESGKVHYETLDGKHHTQHFDFAMLIPAFSGHGFKAYDNGGTDITDKLFAKNGFMKVDADYSGKAYEDWSIDDWPETYQNQDYPNIFAAGIAFAPPHSISKPMKSENGNPIFPAPPRTGMPSGVIGKVIADNVAEWIKSGKPLIKHKASMGRMGAACIVSAGFGMTKGTAATMTVNPVVPDWEKYPKWGRDIKNTVGEPGLAGHWMKWFMHYMFLYKAKGKPFWWLLPE